MQDSELARLAFLDVAQRKWLRGVRRVVVEGRSMEPALRPGDTVTALWRWRPLRPGDLVVVRDPREATRWLIKRCQLVPDRRVELRGDNADESTDSRHFGPLRRRDVRWLVLSSSSPKSQ